jgi:hypothetical protein
MAAKGVHTMELPYIPPLRVLCHMPAPVGNEGVLQMPLGASKGCPPMLPGAASSNGTAQCLHAGPITRATDAALDCFLPPINTSSAPMWREPSVAHSAQLFLCKPVWADAIASSSVEDLNASLTCTRVRNFSSPCPRSVNRASVPSTGGMLPAGRCVLRCRGGPLPGQRISVNSPS